jgi:hypothetical protein
MREHGGATRPGMALVIAGATLIATLLFAPSASAVAGGPISGETEVGETLTASPAHVYHWQRCDPEAGPCNSSGTLWFLDEGWSHIPGASGHNDTTYTLTEDDLGMMIRVLSNEIGLGLFAASPAVGPVGGASVPPAPVIHPPEFGSTANLDPVSGTVLAKLPGSDEIQQIRELTQVPVGTTVDVSHGFVDLTTQRGPNEGLQTVTLWDGGFVFRQRLKNRITVMRLTSGLASASGAGQAQAAGKRGKRLWGRGRCRCRHRGRNSSGTARGTWWLTAERKRGTFTKVKKGTVVVRDFTRNRKVKVTAGEGYLARNR